MVDKLRKLDAVISDLETQARAHSDFVGVLNEVGTLVSLVEKVSAEYRENVDSQKEIERSLILAIADVNTMTQETQASIAGTASKLETSLEPMSAAISDRHDNATRLAILEIKSNSENALAMMNRTMQNAVAESHATIAELHKKGFAEIREQQARLETKLLENLQATSKRNLIAVVVGITTAVGVLLAAQFVPFDIWR